MPSSIDAESMATRIKLGKPDLSVRKDGATIALRFPFELESADEEAMKFADEDWIGLFKEASRLDGDLPQLKLTGNTLAEIVVATDQLEASVAALRRCVEIANERYESEVKPAKQAAAEELARKDEQRRQQKESVQRRIDELFADDA